METSATALSDVSEPKLCQPVREAVLSKSINQSLPPDGLPKQPKVLLQDSLTASWQNRGRGIFPSKTLFKIPWLEQ